MLKGLFTKKNTLDKEIQDVIGIMKTHDPASKEYSTIAQNIEMLYKAKGHSRSVHITPDGVMMAATNLVGLWLVLNFEKADIIRSKAFGMVGKLRV